MTIERTTRTNEILIQSNKKINNIYVKQDEATQLKKMIGALFATGLIGMTFTVRAQTLDLSLSSPGWTTGGNTGDTQTGDYVGSGVGAQLMTGTQTISCCGPNTWTISPVTGTSMMGLQPGGPQNYSSMTSALGLSSSSISALNAEIAAQSGSGNITNTSWISKDFNFLANTQFKMAWVYTSTDYVPFNDGSITTLVNTGSQSILGKINGVSAQYLLLGATNPGTGNYSTDSYGSTGWQWVNYKIETAGTYKLGFAIFNQGDTSLSPVLFVNDGLGTVNKNGTPFNPVAPNNPNMPTTNPDGTVTDPTTTPTVVSTAPGTPIVTTTTSNGTSVTTPALSYGTTSVAVENVNSKGANDSKLLTVTKTVTATATTPFALVYTTTTPVTTTTTTTPTTVKTWSDGSTTTENGTPVTTTSTSNQVSTSTVTGNEITQTINQQDYQTRIDQYSQLGGINSKLNSLIESDPFNRVSVSSDGLKQRNFTGLSYNFYMTGTGMNTNRVDTYRNNGNTYGIGIERLFTANTLFGIMYHKANVDLGGHNAGGSLDKSVFSAYSLNTWKNWIVKSDFGYSNNKYATNHSIPELELFNTSRTRGSDKWVQSKMYTPDYQGVRAFVGVRAETSRINSVVESGSEVSSMSYDAQTQFKRTGLIGYRYDYNFNRNWAFNAETVYASKRMNLNTFGITYNSTKNSTIEFRFGGHKHNEHHTVTAGAQARINF